MAHARTRDETPQADAALIRVGVIGAARGLKGEVRVKSFTQDPQAIGDYGPLTDETGTKAFTLKVLGLQKGLVLVRIKGVNDRNAAEALNGQVLYVARERLPKPEDDEFYFADLIGLKAKDTEGGAFGDVVDADDYGGGPFLEIATREHGRVLVPFTKACVPVVDLDGQHVVVDPPEGLLEPGRPEPQGSPLERNGGDDDR